MTLGNSRIEKSSGELLSEVIHSRSRSHCGGNSANSLVPLGKLTKLIAEDLGEILSAWFNSARFGIETAHSVVNVRFILSKERTLALFGFQVNDYRLVQILDDIQNISDRLEIVSVKRAVVLEAEVSENSGVDNAAFHLILHVSCKLSNRRAYHGNFIKYSLCVFLDLDIF